MLYKISYICASYRFLWPSHSSAFWKYLKNDKRKEMQLMFHSEHALSSGKQRWPDLKNCISVEMSISCKKLFNQLVPFWFNLFYICPEENLQFFKKDFDTSTLNKYTFWKFNVRPTFIWKNASSGITKAPMKTENNIEQLVFRASKRVLNISGM